jgi:membrane protease YdiL (CAAX protease family)
MLGALLMAVPAAVLWLSGSVQWRLSASDPSIVAHAVLGMAAVAMAEELLFRGFLFQRLIAGLGMWPAQLIISGLFVLTHLGNPGMDGATRLWAGLNIFIASLLFGFAYLRTRALALPIGIHFAANVTQGPILGLGVSGNSEPGLLEPLLQTSKDWLTGGQFGLEASLPGLLTVGGGALLLSRTRQRRSKQAEAQST